MRTQTITNLLFVAAILGVIAGAEGAAGQDEAAKGRPERVTAGLRVLHDFTSIADGVVRDGATREAPADLKVTNPKAVRHTGDGLEILNATILHTEQPAQRLSDAIRQSGAITLEAWIRPADVKQTGPARVVTLSASPNERNFTLGQDGDKFEVRFRTTKTSTNGVPALVSKPNAARAEWTHVVYTRDRAGNAKLYIDAKLSTEQNIGGDVSNWDRGYRLALANELTNDRPWRGTVRLAAVYDRDLSPEEVKRNFDAGRIVDPQTERRVQLEANARLFESRIAPLLSQHCLECHDTATRKGGLDLSRRDAALAGGKQGPAIVPGKPGDSELWALVESNEMPSDRPPLSDEQKRLVKQWIEGGAAWSLEAIDAAVYAHGESSSKVFASRLTVPEYIATVKATLGVDIADDARRLLPPDLRADGFRNTAYNLTVDLGHVEAYAKLAEVIVQRIDVKALARKHTNSRELTDENLTKVIEPVGRLLLRGPVSKQEVALYCGVSTTVAATGGDFDDAVRHIVQTMLQSPRFLYRIERQHGDGSPRPLDSHELATRLSYIVWGAPPDEPLMQAADKGALNRQAVEAHARRMLKDPRAVERSRQFISEWLNLDRLSNLRPDPKRFANWDPALAGDMRRETLAFFEEIVWKQNRPLSDLLSAKLTFVTPRLAKHYGLTVEPAGSDDALVRVDLSSVPGRGGLLTHGSVLTVGGDDASMVTRGLFLMHELLRGVVRDPPPCVDTTPVPSKPGLTQRMVSEQRLADKACMGCHARFEPPAFAFERFDGLGSYHESDEHGNKLRDDGHVLIPGQEKPTRFESTAELMNLLAGSERVRQSFTWKVAQFAVGRPLGAQDARHIAEVHRSAQQRGGTYAELLVALVTSDLVLMTPTEPAE